VVGGVDTRIDRRDVKGVATRVFHDKGTPKRSVRVLSEYGSGVHYAVHNDSLINLARGVVERVLYTVVDGVLSPVIQPKPDVFKRLIPLRNRVLRHTPTTTPVDRDKFPELYTGRRRMVYQQACDSLCVEAVSRKDSNVKTFVKAEKINFSAKVDPAPRVIQPRDPRYNVEVGCFLKPFEKAICKGFRRTYGYNVICKGLNAQGTAQQLKENWDTFQKPVAVGLDASRFDQHVSVDALKYEHSFYNLKFRNDHLEELLSWQLRTTGYGRAKDGSIKYTVNGCRMSGDMNTSMGNCIIMSSIVLQYFAAHKINARLANNGDDCVVILEQSQLHKLGSIDQWFLDFGFKLTREDPVTVFEHIEFCQTQPVLCANGWRMVRNIHTATSKDVVSMLSWDNELEFNRWRNAISECGLSLTRGVPVWEKFYQNLWAPHSLEHAHQSIADTGMGHLSVGVEACAIDEISRYSFYLAFGIFPDAQDAIERGMPPSGLAAAVPRGKDITKPRLTK